MTNEGPVDWPALIADLSARLGGSGKVCDLAGVAHASLRDWACGRSEPRFYNGEAVLALWMRVTGRNRSQAPRKAPFQRQAARVVLA